MILYEAVGSEYISYAIRNNSNVLVSYYYKSCITKERLEIIKQKKLKLFIDSGAFSAENIGAKIDLYKYINYLHEINNYIYMYAGLDDISDYKKTILNNKIMENAGLKPTITFHFNEPIELLKDYLTEYDKICLGGVVGKSRNVKVAWLDKLYSQVISQFPLKKIHMFGVHDKYILLRYPFFSADAATGIKRAVNGGSSYLNKTIPEKSLEFIKHTNLEKAYDRYANILSTKLQLEKYITEVWRRRGITW